MSDYSPVWPHGDIIKAFEGIYNVRGTNIVHFEGKEIQHSRSMTIIVQEGSLTLINSVRLSEKGLEELEKLGTVRNVISIGAFHGRDDAFYLERYQAKLWTVHEPSSYHNTHYLQDTDKLPINNGYFFMFKNTNPAEGFIYITNHEGIIITCDSVKNWVHIDEFFNEDTAMNALADGEIAKARISPIWLQATGMDKVNFNHLLQLKFKHLISAHGDVLRDTAHNDIESSVNNI